MAAPLAKLVSPSSTSRLFKHLSATYTHGQKCYSNSPLNWMLINRMRRNMKICGLGVATGALLLYGQRTHNIAQRCDDECDLVPRLYAATPSNHDNVDPSCSRVKQFNFIADVVEKAAPAVVNIEITGSQFGRNMTVSNGSGFVVQEDGLILTNAHVVANKRVVKIKLQDGRSFEGVVQFVDPVSDLATIKIPCNNLPYLKLAKSLNVRPGEWVVAMGSPLSLSNTVTAGIVSTVSRGSKELGLRHKDMNYIQTDAVINFGNSGGPLINLDGEAVGINTMKVTTGISFAIPADYATEFLDKTKKLQQTRESKSWFNRATSNSPTVFKRKYIGVTMLTLTPDIIALLKLGGHVTHGVRVERVVVDSPVHRAGIMPGDILVEINGQKITKVNDVYTAVNSGKDLKVAILRGESQQLYHCMITPEEVEG